MAESNSGNDDTPPKGSTARVKGLNDAPVSKKLRMTLACGRCRYAHDEKECERNYN